MEKQNVVYIHNGILFSQKKEWNSDICINMDKSKKTLCQVKKARHQRAHIILFHLYEISMIDKSIELEISQ